MTSAFNATPAACSILPVGRRANSATDETSPSVAAFYSAAAFVNTWVSAPPRTVTTRPDYGPQYNGVGECPF